MTENKNNKLIIIGLAVLTLGQAAYIGTHGSSLGNGAMKRTYSGDVIAKVNGTPIHEEEIRERLDFITGGKGSSISLDNIDEKGLEALAREVYVQNLVLEKAVESGVQKDPDLKNKIASLVNTIYKEKFLEKIAKKDVTDEMVKKTYDQLVSKAKTSKQYHVEHILVKTEDEAKEIKKKLDAGSKFEDLARLDSIDKPSAEKGGDLGYIFPDEFVPEFAAEVKKLNKGETSNPVKSEFGWHIIKVEDSKNAEIVPFEDAKPRIEKQLGSESVKKFVDDISKDLKIEVIKKPAAPAAAADKAATPAKAPAAAKAAAKTDKK